VSIVLSEMAKQEFLVNMQHALLMWLALIGLAAAGFGVLTALSRRGKKAAKREQRERLLARPSPQAQARELRRYAEEVGVAAERAAVMARRRHADWVAVHRTREAAWRAYELADEAARRVDEANAFPVLTEQNVVDEEFELASRRRHQHRMASEAHERGEISAEQLGDALFHRNGWDPRRHPFEQEAKLRHVVRDRLLGAYQEASRIEQNAWHAADMAAAARRSLEDEAFTASMRVRRAQQAKVPVAKAAGNRTVRVARRREALTAG
jgi:hypothetical protein